MAWVRRLRERVLVVILALGASGAAQAYTVVLTQQDIKDEMKEYFPVVNDAAGVRTKMDLRDVWFLKGQNRIAVRLAVSSEIVGVGKVSGTSEISGELDYSRERREFYLREPRVLALTLDDMPPGYAPMVEQGIQALVRDAWPIIVVYRLTRKQVQESLSMRLLKSVQVKDEKLFLELGW